MADSEAKKAFPLRIPPPLFDQIRIWAEQDLRSINGQIEYILSDAVRHRLRSSGKPAAANPAASSTESAPGTAVPPKNSSG